MILTVGATSQNQHSKRNSKDRLEKEEIAHLRTIVENYRSSKDNCRELPV